MAYESGFRTTLASKLDPSDTTMSVATAPTITAGRVFLKNGTQREWIKFTGVTGTTLTGLTRGLSQTADPATEGTGSSWLAGTEIVIVAMHDQLPDKSLPNTWADDQTFEGDMLIDKTDFKMEEQNTNFRIRLDSGEMKFRDDETAEVALKTLASAAGADQYVAVSENDTTVGHLDDKFGSGAGLSETITNPAGNEVLTVAVDTTDTDVFVKTSSGAGDEDKVPVCGADGKIASGFVNYTDNAITPSSFTLGEDMTALDVAYLGYDGNAYKYGGDLPNTYADSSQGMKTIKLTSTIVVTVLDDGDDIKAKVGTIDGDTITYGGDNAVVTVAGIDDHDWDIAKVSDTEFIFIHCAAAENGDIDAYHCTVSGTTVTPGAKQTIVTFAAGTLARPVVEYVEDDKVMCVYTTGNNTIGIVISNSTGTYSVGANNGLYDEAAFINLVPYTTNKLYLVQEDDDDDVQCSYITISGTTNAETSINNETTTMTEIAANSVGDSKLLVRYTEAANTKAYLVDDTTKGTTLTVVSGSAVSPEGIVAFDDYTYGVLTSTNTMYILKNTTAQTLELVGTITMGASWSTSNDFSWKKAAIQLDTDRGTAVFTGQGGTYVVTDAIQRILGILQETGSATDSKEIALTGQTSSGHSSLNVANQYYIQPADGSIDIAESSYPLGLSHSTTTIHLDKLNTTTIYS